MLHKLLPELALSSRSLFFEETFGPEQTKEFGNLIAILIRRPDDESLSNDDS